MIGIIAPLEEHPLLMDFVKKRDWRKRPSVSIGTETDAQKPGQMKSFVSGVRRGNEIVVARGGTEEMNRAVLETPEVDILLDHDIGGRCGINHILARLAKKNNVSIGFDLNRLMVSYRLGRIQEFSAMTETVKIVRKFNAPYVLTSGAMDVWDMRSPSELIAMGRQLGFTEAEARRGLSGRIVKENRKRLSGKWIMPGVEIDS
jgi:ribonuclease P/MRP protein subunit RPP1